MARLTYAQKSARQTARWYGKRAAAAISSALHLQREADVWRELETKSGVGGERSLRALRSADQWQADAERQARAAAHYALESL